jgi:uncharacterized membrane protein
MDKGVVSRTKSGCQVMDLNGQVVTSLYCAGESAGGFNQHGMGRCTTQRFHRGETCGEGMNEFRRFCLLIGLAWFSHDSWNQGRTRHSLNEFVWLSLPKITSNISTFLRQGGFWRAFLVVCCFIALCFVYEKLLAWTRRQRSIKQSWVSYQAKQFTVLKIGRKQLFFQAVSDKIRYPNFVSLFLAVGIVGVVFLVEALVRKLELVFLGYLPVACNNREFFSTLWQVQAELSAAALPILIFVIELSKDQNNLATRSSQVLIRET